MEVIEAALVEVGVAQVAVFAAAAIGIHGVLEIDDDLKAVVLQAGDGFIGHEQVFFRSGFEGANDIEQPGFDDENGDGDAALAGYDEFHVGPFVDACAAAASSAEEGQLHCAGVDWFESCGETGDELVGAGKADFRVVNAEGRHALQQADGVGQGDIDVGLLHSVAKAGFKQLDVDGFFHELGFLAG
jgi:hypothetical protein